MKRYVYDLAEVPLIAIAFLILCCMVIAVISADAARSCFRWAMNTLLRACDR